MKLKTKCVRVLECLCGAGFALCQVDCLGRDIKCLTVPLENRELVWYRAEQAAFIER